MKFRLSTLLIVVTGLAILFAQHESAIRLTAVAVIEIALVVGWNARKGGAFPWAATLATAGAICSTVAGIFFIVYNPAERLDARIALTVLVASGVAIGLFFLIGLFYVVYSLFQDPFRLNPGLPRRPPRDQSSDYFQAQQPTLTKFRLSTLLIVVTALAILFAQYPAWDRFAAVAMIEMALAIGWMAAKGHPFPWKTALGVVLACDLAVVASVFFSFGDFDPHLFGDLMDRLIGSLVLVFVVSNVLMIPLGLLYVLHKAVEAVFRLNCPEFAASPVPKTRQSSD